MTPNGLMRHSATLAGPVPSALPRTVLLQEPSQNVAQVRCRRAVAEVRAVAVVLG